jgi:hypothetical protein
VWAQSAKAKPYGSYGTGSAMRVSPVGFAFDDLETILAEAKRSAEVLMTSPRASRAHRQPRSPFILLAKDKFTLRRKSPSINCSALYCGEGN